MLKQTEVPNALADNAAQVDAESQPTKKLISVIQQLSMAKSHEDIRDIVKHAARELVGSDGATFVLRDGDQCYYVDEEAISPLWKGERFPMAHCISGWVMSHKESLVLPDIYADSRIPADVYRPTFVKSLVMVPIRTINPVGAIGNYWKEHHEATKEEIALLQALADSTSIAMENVNLYNDLESRIEARVKALEETNEELEAFSYSVSHDLRAPLRAIEGFAHLLQTKHKANLEEEGQHYLDKITESANKMSLLIRDLLYLSRVVRADIKHVPVDISRLCQSILNEYAEEHPAQTVTWNVQKDIMIEADDDLLHILFKNLIGNAWKYSSKKSQPHIEVKAEKSDGTCIVSVTDNGVGFDIKEASRIFDPFQRLYSAQEYPGTGIGLAIVKRIISRHDGEVWAESTPNQGSTFYVLFKHKDEPKEQLS